MCESRGSVLCIFDRDRLVTSLDLFQMFLDGIEKKHGRDAGVGEMKIWISIKRDGILVRQL